MSAGHQTDSSAPAPHATPDKPGAYTIRFRLRRNAKNEGMVYMKSICARCGKEIPEKKHLLQAITYLGASSKRFEVCSDCYSLFIKWLDNPMIELPDPPEDASVAQLASEDGFQTARSMVRVHPGAPYGQVANRQTRRTVNPFLSGVAGSTPALPTICRCNPKGKGTVC